MNYLCILVETVCCNSLVDSILYASIKRSLHDQWSNDSSEYIVIGHNGMVDFLRLAVPSFVTCAMLLDASLCVYIWITLFLIGQGTNQHIKNL